MCVEHFRWQWQDELPCQAPDLHNFHWTRTLALSLIIVYRAFQLMLLHL